MARQTTQSRSHSPIQPKSTGWINEFLWTCAGVNKQVLRQCPADYAKYAGIGGTILFTALMAMFSGGYALTYVFGNPWIGLLFGCFWGLLIFNLDRFIVNTMYSDGKHTISWDELKSGLPRIIMAIFLGIVISYPLELKLFDDEIQVKIDELKGDRLREFVEIDQARLDSLESVVAALRENPTSLHASQIIGGNDQLNTLSQQRKDANAHFQAEQQAINSLTSTINHLKATNEEGRNDKDISAKSQERTNHQVKRNQFRSQINTLDAQMAALSPQIAELINKQTADQTSVIARKEQEIKSLQLKIQKADSIYRKTLDKNFNGLQAQMLAFNEMKNTKLEGELFSSTQVAAWLIMILFIIIETAPTFFKMMMEDGPYDDMLRAEKHRISVMADKSISDLNDEVNTAVRISTMRNEKRLEAETIANQDILEKIARAQAELLETAIAGWKERELEKIRQNPENYVVSLVPPRQEIEVVADAAGNIREATDEDRRVVSTMVDATPEENESVDNTEQAPEDEGGNITLTDNEETQS